MKKSKFREALRPLVREALSDYLKDTEQDLRALQAAHPQLDIKKDLPSETPNGDNVTKGVRTEAKGGNNRLHKVEVKIEDTDVNKRADLINATKQKIVQRGYEFDKVEKHHPMYHIYFWGPEKSLSKQEYVNFSPDKEHEIKHAGRMLHIPGKKVTREGIEGDVKWIDRAGARVKKVNGKTVIFPANPKNTQKIADALNDSGEYEVKVLKGGGILVKYQSPLTKMESKVEEASTTAGNPDMGYQTPYAFSGVGLDKDVKKRKIAQQLGYKIVKKNSIKEEVNVNIVKAVPLGESFKPQLTTPIANQLYMKMLDYLLMSSDPQYRTIHKFRVAIDKVPNQSDKKQLILAFNDEFRVGNGSSQSAWDYYKDVD